MEGVWREECLAERLSNGVRALAVAPSLPPAGDDCIESEAANPHEAWVKGDGLVRRRGAVRAAGAGGCAVEESV